MIQESALLQVVNICMHAMNVAIPHLQAKASEPFHVIPHKKVLTREGVGGYVAVTTAISETIPSKPLFASPL